MGAGARLASGPALGAGVEGAPVRLGGAFASSFLSGMLIASAMCSSSYSAAGSTSTTWAASSATRRCTSSRSTGMDIGSPSLIAQSGTRPTPPAASSLLGTRASDGKDTGELVGEDAEDDKPGADEH